MKRKGIKNLIFDFGGVLINLDRQRCIENFRKLGIREGGRIVRHVFSAGNLYAT